MGIFSEYRWSRKPVHPAIEASLLSGGKLAASGKIRSIGLHGLFLETEGKFKEGAPVQVCFRLDRNVSYRLFGTVAQKAADGIAVVVDILHPDSRDGLQAVMDYAGMGQWGNAPEPVMAEC